MVQGELEEEVYSLIYKDHDPVRRRWVPTPGQGPGRGAKDVVMRRK